MALIKCQELSVKRKLDYRQIWLIDVVILDLFKIPVLELEQFQAQVFIHLRVKQIRRLRVLFIFLAILMENELIVLLFRQHVVHKENLVFGVSGVQFAV